uniref:Uncharacterized protein n=1 Tax=Anguilla anguilla TaxID=7936 RepID=A0A0E9R448_ANGAN
MFLTLELCMQPLPLCSDSH